MQTGGWEWEWHASRGNSGYLVWGEARVGCVLWLNETHRDRSVSVFVGASIKCSFLLMKGKYKKQAPLLGAAAAGTQYRPLFACGWWWSGGECKDHSHCAHILLFSSQVEIDVVTFSAQNSVDSCQSWHKCDLNQQFELSNIFCKTFLMYFVWLCTFAQMVPTMFKPKRDEGLLKVFTWGGLALTSRPFTLLVYCDFFLTYWHLSQAAATHFCPLQIMLGVRYRYWMKPFVCALCSFHRYFCTFSENLWIQTNRAVPLVGVGRQCSSVANTSSEIWLWWMFLKSN